MHADPGRKPWQQDGKDIHLPLTMCNGEFKQMSHGNYRSLERRLKRYGNQDRARGDVEENR